MASARTKSSTHIRLCVVDVRLAQTFTKFAKSNSNYTEIIVLLKITVCEGARALLLKVVKYKRTTV